MTPTAQATNTLTVSINGTDKNPWHRFGLTQNPFPQLARVETDAGEQQIASLDGDPVTSVEDIRTRLAGFSEEFITLCVAQWQPGVRVRFAVTFPDR